MAQDSAEAMLVVDDGGVVRFANSAARQLLGDRAAPGQTLGMPPASNERQEFVVQRASGTTTTVEVQAHEFTWEGKSAQVVTMREATERPPVSERIDQLNHVLCAIRNLGQLIARESNPIRLVQEACGLLVGRAATPALGSLWAMAAARQRKLSGQARTSASRNSRAA